RYGAFPGLACPEIAVQGYGQIAQRRMRAHPDGKVDGLLLKSRSCPGKRQGAGVRFGPSVSPETEPMNWLSWCNMPPGTETARKRRALSGSSITAWIGPSLREWTWCSERFGKSLQAQRFHAWFRFLFAEKGRLVWDIPNCLMPWRYCRRSLPRRCT